jgi:hypothetical protein
MQDPDQQIREAGAILGVVLGRRLVEFTRPLQLTRASERLHGDRFEPVGI